MPLSNDQEAATLLVNRLVVEYDAEKGFRHHFTGEIPVEPLIGRLMLIISMAQDIQKDQILQEQVKKSGQKIQLANGPISGIRPPHF